MPLYSERLFRALRGGTMRAPEIQGGRRRMLAPVGGNALESDLGTGPSAKLQP
ncbi:hypothetical protein KCG44_14210 [Pacificimonas sp. WHA3]|uniref:Uncharacterized protein n=1 Tax=Pacificimonas pallii TaxID=2827236 RepID=A0ABS6SJ04_9SPHN|nr:hypothetical protein [Pacificimonas pallii]MBV7257936.1 hypothetical protein [Pacificimonas pallii]